LLPGGNTNNVSIWVDTQLRPVLKVDQFIESSTIQCTNVAPDGWVNPGRERQKEMNLKQKRKR